VSKRSEADPIRVVLHIDDRVLAERLEALLANVRGLRLVDFNESADAALVPATAALASPHGDVPLTPRETEVLALLAEALSNKAIARRLGISVHTAKFHVRALIDKLDAVGRTDAVAHAARRGVIHL
jgi:DNA-binding CsgD family transcriptional regulator